MTAAPSFPLPPESVLPPGPRRNLLWRAFGRLRFSDPLRLMSYFARTYGDIVHYRIGTMRFLLLSHPNYVREVLIAQPDRFIKERTMQRSKMLLGEGMITAEGAAHRRQRQAAQPAFHRRQIPEYAPAMAEYAREMRDQWHPGMRVDALQEMMCLTLRIVAQTLFSTEIKDQVREIATAINNIMGLYKWLVTLPAIEFLVKLPLPGIGRFTKARGRLDQLVYGMIDEHRRMCGGDTLAGERACLRDLLSLMLTSGATESAQGIRDQVITIFLAGYETTATALTWTWYLLSQNPQVESRLHAEVDTVLAGRLPAIGDLPKLRYTEMVLAESMRLFPPAWAVGRQAIRDFQLKGYRVPAGTYAVMSQWVIHRDARFFPNPLAFTPERFSPEAEASRPHFSYFPFGAGQRQCIGEEFAWKEMVLVLATFAQRWKLRLAAGSRVEPEALITLRPKYGMPMDVVERIL